MTEEQINYQEQVQPTQAQAELNTLQQNPVTTSTEEMQSQNERVMFEKYVQDGGQAIPSNFKSAGDWFDSLKESQKQYTQGQQEIADLKRQYSTEGVTNPNYQPNANENVAAPTVTGDEELRLQPTYEEEIAPIPGLTPELWNSWSEELATRGEMSPQTMSHIQQVTHLPVPIINDYLSAQKSRMRESFTEASKIVGGKENLKQIFEWAETSLPAEEQDVINQGLAGASYEVTLRGLADMYNTRSAAAEREREPNMTPNLQQVAASDTGYQGYRTKREFTADRNNPRFRLEPAYRQAVEQRMARTDFNSLPA